MCVQVTKTANRFEISPLLEKILLKQFRWCLTFVDFIWHFCIISQIKLHGFWKPSALTNMKKDALKYMINRLWYGIFISQPYQPETPISTRDAHISPRANMGRGLIWHVMWKMPYNNLYLLFAFLLFLFCFLINFLLHHFQHTDSGNENIDWLIGEICTELFSHVLHCVAWFAPSTF